VDGRTGVCGANTPLLDSLFEGLQSFCNNRAAGKELTVLGIGHTVQVNNGINPLKNLLLRDLGQLILQAGEPLWQVCRFPARHGAQELNEESGVPKITFHCVLKRFDGLARVVGIWEDANARLLRVGCNFLAQRF
jgi:hypothetical protein